MNILIIGCGFIGNTIAKAAEDMETIEKVYFMDKHREKLEKTSSTYSKSEMSCNLSDALNKVDLVIEAASQEALMEFGIQVLNEGKDLIMLSVGALHNEKFTRKLLDTAMEKGAKVCIPSGAIGGLDAIKSAQCGELRKVTLETRKSMTSLGMEQIPEKPVVVFEGPASLAIKRFPKNINIAASISLVGLGFERTKVKIILDPSVKKNIHTITAEGDFGSMTMIMENNPAPENPRTSQLAALSAISTLKQITNPIHVGV